MKHLNENNEKLNKIEKRADIYFKKKKVVEEIKEEEIVVEEKEEIPRKNGNALSLSAI